jgi:hypothetical protein
VFDRALHLLLGLEEDLLDHRRRLLGLWAWFRWLGGALRR